MAEQEYAHANGIELCFESHGSEHDPAVLLVMGLGAQLTGWPDAMVAQLLTAGLRVVRFDNRDCGLSTKFEQQVDVHAFVRAWTDGTPMPAAPYSLSDMARDAVGLLDHLGIAQAHVVGASLGGMIVQTLAIEHPHRVRSLTSIMSTTGEKAYYTSANGIRAAMYAPRPPDRAGQIDAGVAFSRMISSRRWFDAGEAARRIGEAYDRSFFPAGIARQTAAVRSSGDRAAGLRALRVPALVVHGRDDTLIEPRGGMRTAELIDGSALLLLSDMGHDMPAPLLPYLTDSIVAHLRRA